MQRKINKLIFIGFISRTLILLGARHYRFIYNGANYTKICCAKKLRALSLSGGLG